jgi:hypothetical protein
VSQHSILQIDKLNLQLPSGFETRAPLIVRMLADRLGSFDFGHDISIPRLSIPEITVAAKMSDSTIAATIADSIRSSLMPRQGLGSATKNKGGN